MVKKSTMQAHKEEIDKKIAEMEAAHRRFYSIRALKTIDGLFSTPASERTYFDYCRFSYLNFDGHRNKDGSIDKRTMEAKRFYDLGIGNISKAVKNHTEAVENAKNVLKRLKRKPYRRFRLRKAQCSMDWLPTSSAHGITPNQLRSARVNLRKRKY